MYVLYTSIIVVVMIQISKQKIPRGDNTSSEPLCPLLAKDSEWVDALQTNSANVPNTSSSVSDDEEILQLVNFTFYLSKLFNMKLVNSSDSECDDLCNATCRYWMNLENLKKPTSISRL